MQNGSHAHSAARARHRAAPAAHSRSRRPAAENPPVAKRPAPKAPAPKAPAPKAPAPKPSAARTTALTASAAAIALVSSVLFALPADASVVTMPNGYLATAASGHEQLQGLTVSGLVAAGSAQRDDPVAAALAGVIASEGGSAGQQAAAALSAALQTGGERQRIVATALTYLGDPYVLDGSSHSGIDCSGLVMMSYAAVGIRLGHLVHLQDDAGTRIDESAAEPGDLVVFDDEEHIAIYLGGGVLIQAPAVGRPVEITTVWQGVPHHFTRLLP